MLCFTENRLPLVMYAGTPFTSNWNGAESCMTQQIGNMSHSEFRQAISGRKGLFLLTADFYYNINEDPHATILHWGFPGINTLTREPVFVLHAVLAQ